MVQLALRIDIAKTAPIATTQQFNHSTTQHLSECRHPPEFLEPAVDVRTTDLLEAIEAESFDRETGGYNTAGDCPFQRRRGKVAIRCNQAHETAGKAISCAGWVDNIRRGISRQNVRFVLAKEHSAVLSLLEHHKARTHRLNQLTSTHQIVRSGEPP